MGKITLCYAAFPGIANGFGGLTRISPSGRVSILINNGRSDEEQKRTLKHELSHIILGHLWDDRVHGEDLSYLDDNPEIEDEADRYADQMTDETLAELVSGLIGETVYL